MRDAEDPRDGLHLTGIPVRDAALQRRGIEQQRHRECRQRCNADDTSGIPDKDDKTLPNGKALA